MKLDPKIESLLYQCIMLKQLANSFLCTYQEKRRHRKALEETQNELIMLGYTGDFP